MQVTEINDIKIYNISSGKSIPEWLSDRKKRSLVKRDVELRRRIQLIQDFEMPQVSNCIKMSPDGQYILATGVYKPRVRCYDVNELAMKFERCYDSEAIKFEILSDDYSKLILLQSDRYVEIHSQFGRYYRFRIPKFGHDLSYDKTTCDLYLVGATPEVYRLNLEQGRFLNPYQTQCSSINACEINPVHNLFVCGSEDGHVEAWDSRSRSRVGLLDTALHSVSQNADLEGLPSVTSLAFRDAINLAVGTATGQILLYDLRSSKPYFIKDHLYGLPIKRIEYLPQLDLVASMDSKILKLWSRNEEGKPFTALQTQADLNDFCIVPNSGLLFLANEDTKMLTYYIPSLGIAPKWCSFLDRIVEELEETSERNIYDDFKFVTNKELEELGLTNLIGTNLLRASMHGFLMDIRLYNKTKAASNLFAYEEYKKKKIKEKIESERSNRVTVKTKLPKVNKLLAQKLLEEQENESTGKDKKPRKEKSSLLKDERFKEIFENPDYELDPNSEEYKRQFNKFNKTIIH